MSSNSCTALVVYSGDTTTISTDSHNNSKQRYVGLSNQGATCYMNSLLQTLYMTPEFRTALYKWKYDPEKDGNEGHCIPLQLQKLFGLLQISNSRSVDTIALTKSFGWEGSEVFQQQDVQELCRVLFDALEQCFKGSELEKAIDDIYAGEMVDYVKCIDIDYQSERRDKFLDCSLAIRPYGSTKSMKSLSECLEHYLEPEILDGDNKYFAESVGRKVDAIKGLKFSRLPLVLSVQLKRFVYDFSGDSIIQMKINDEVKFPLVLDLNKYVSRCQKVSQANTDDADGETIIDEFEEFLQKKIRELREKKSDAPIPDATSLPQSDEKKGSDWNSGRGSPASLVYEYDNLESKEDVDIPDLVDCNGNLHPDIVKERQAQSVEPVAPPRSDDIDVETQSHLNLDNLKELVKERGEWIYELYAVLVHSGAISGGHYYVYIKDVETNKWWNFNDSYVDEITVDKVLQASGGMIQHTSYYGAKSQILSSANAYMLMYRKVSLSEPKAHFPPDTMVPEYIKEEIQKLTELAEKRRKEDEERFNRLPLQIYWNSKSHSVISNRYASYKALLQQVWTELNLYNSPEYQEILKRNSEVENSKSPDQPSPPVDPLVVPFDEIRLRIYSSYNKLKQDPFSVETRGNMSLEAIRVTTYRELAVELKSRYDEWEVYEADGFNLQMYEYDPEKDDFKPPVSIRVPRNSTLKDLKAKISQLPGIKHLDISTLRILKLAVWSFSDIKVDEITSTSHDIDHYRLILDLRLCEGQKIYLESNSVPVDESPSVKCFTAQMNRINVLVNKPGVVDEPDRTISVDRRLTMKEFRQVIGKELDIDPDSFRIFRKTALESELNGDKAQSLYALGIYNGIALHLSEGRPLLPGHFLLKLYLYTPPFRSGLNDIQTMDCAVPELENVSVPEPIETPEVVEASATVVQSLDCDTSSNDVVFADNVASVPVTISDASPVVATETPTISLYDIDIDVLNNGVSEKIVTKPVANNDPFKIDDDTPESSSTDILGFGYKMIELLPSSDQFEFLCDFDVEGDSKVCDIKQRIYEYLVSEGKIPENFTAHHIRLRTKSRNTLSNILSDHLTLRENQIHLYSGREVAVEILDHEEKFSTLPYGDVIVYVQKWDRKTWRIEKPIEVILRGSMSVQEISKKLAYLTNITLEGMRVLLLQPYNEVKLCDLYLNQPSGPRPWTNTSKDMRKLSQMQWFLRDWDTLLVQDVTEPLKKLSKTEIQTVKEAKAYQSNYGYDYYYDGPYVTPVGNHTGSQTGTSSNSDVTKRPVRVERGIQIKTQKDREKERQQLENEKKENEETMVVDVSSITSNETTTNYVLFSDVE